MAEISISRFLEIGVVPYALDYLANLDKQFTVVDVDDYGVSSFPHVEACKHLLSRKRGHDVPITVVTRSGEPCATL